MGIFASRSTKTIDIPFDLPNTVTVRQLTGKQLGKASDAFWFEMADDSRDKVRLQKELKELRSAVTGPDEPESDDDKAAAKAAKAEAIKTAQADPLNGYSKSKLIALGVTDYAGAGPFTSEQIDDLNDEASVFFAGWVLRHTKPSLFKSEDERKADQKNG